MQKRVKIDQYFLTETCPFSNRRKIKPRAIYNTLIGGVVVFIFFVLWFGGGKDKTEPVLPSVPITGTSLNSDSPHPANDDSMFYKTPQMGQGVSRQYTASQIVRYGEGNMGDKLPLGSTIVATLLNKLVSSDHSAPVIGEISNDVLWKNSVVIPQGTRAMGQASFDDSSKRLQIRFQTLVFPEGDQHPISALALLPDGSSGLSGNYHSGTFEKQTGQFISSFVGGLAEGLKKKEPSGKIGLTYEPGSLSNGILNGLSHSAYDQAHNYAEGMKNVHPYLEVEGGSPFLLYLEKEYP